MANDHQHLLEVTETLFKYRSWLTIANTCRKKRYFSTRTLIMYKNP